MKETVLITGANSMIAQHLIQQLQGQYHIKLLTRNPKHNNEFAWNTSTMTIDPMALVGVDHIMHLAGSKLNDGTPLTPARQELVRSSRIGAANLILQTLKKNEQKIKTFVSASAIGIYDYSDNKLEIDEHGHQAGGFIGDLCRDWEAAADEFKIQNIAQHVSKIRVSLVMGEEFAFFQSFLHAAMSSSVDSAPESYLPWNHVEDMAGIFAYAVNQQLDGVYNSVAPVAATSADVIKAISNKINKTQYSITPYKGQRLVAHDIQKAGYQFKYPDIESAVKAILKK